MLIQYHLGLGVGHTYLPHSCKPARASRVNDDGLEEVATECEEEVCTSSQTIVDDAIETQGSSGKSDSDSELDSRSCHGSTTDSDSSELDGNEAASDKDDKGFLAIQEMYGPGI